MRSWIRAMRSSESAERPEGETVEASAQADAPEGGREAPASSSSASSSPLRVQQFFGRHIARTQRDERKNEEKNGHQHQGAKDIERGGGKDGHGRDKGRKAEVDHTRVRIVYIGQEVGGGEGLQHPSALMGLLSDHEDAIDHVDAIESQHRIEPAADMPTAPQIVAKGEAANDGSIEPRAGQGHVAPFGLDCFEIVDSHGYQSETGSIDEHVDHGSQVVVGGPDVKSHLDIVLGGKKHQGKEDHQAGALVAFVLPAGVQAGQGDKERIDQHEDEGGKLK